MLPPSIRILVVEDETAHAEAIRRSLEALEGGEVRVMTSLTEFLEQGAAWDPDVALLDLNLPDGKATEILPDPAESRSFPVIIMTSYGSELTAVGALKAGALDYLVKSPETFQDLPRTILRLLQEWQLRQEGLRMHRELKASEEAYHRQFADNSTIMLMVDPGNGRIIDANAAAVLFYGHSRKQLLARRMASLAVGSGPRAPRGEDPIPQEHGARFQVQHRLADGRVRDVEVSSSRIQVGERKILHLNVHDVTERKRAETQIERRIAALTQPGEGGAITFDELFHLPEIQRIQDEFAAATGVASIITRPDGTPITAPSNFTRLCGDIIRGTEAGCLNCRRSDAALGAFDPDGPVVQTCLSAGLWDAGVRITVAGHYLAHWLIGQVKDQEQDPGWARGYARSIGADEEAYMEAYAQVPAMSRERFQRIAAFLGTLSIQLSGAAYQNLQQARFIAERKGAEEEKTRLEAQLFQSQKMESLGILAGGIAHDMNNVLGAILGMATACVEDMPPGSPARLAFDTIVKAAERGGTMVKSLLSFSRQTPAQYRTVDLNAVLREEVHLLSRTTLVRIRLVLDLAEDLRPVLGDASTLTNAFMNLCINAVDAMPHRGTLTLRTRNLDADWVEILVEDTGCGMSPEVLERALDPFYTTKEMGKGTGLGLSMVFSTVKAHQGSLEIQSEPGSGTQIRVRLPSCQEEATPLGALLASPGETPAGALNVLVADDDELIRSSLEAILEMLGHTTTTVSSGEEALASLEAGLEPDAFILDMNMPGLGGAGTLPRVRALRPNLPVLLATGRTDEATRALLEGDPRVGLLPKPFTMRELQRRLVEIGRS